MNNDKLIIISKLERYCAYQERCSHEVIQKLRTFELSDSERDEILKLLTDEGFIDDRRYALAFARGKSRHKGWGSIKIRHALLAKGIPTSLIQEALLEIGSNDYKEQLIKILSSKKIKDEDPNIRKAKLAQYAIRKGYEASLVWDVLKTIEY